MRTRGVPPQRAHQPVTLPAGTWAGHGGVGRQETRVVRALGLKQCPVSRHYRGLTVHGGGGSGGYTCACNTSQRSGEGRGGVPVSPGRRRSAQRPRHRLREPGVWGESGGDPPGDSGAAGSGPLGAVVRTGGRREPPQRRGGVRGAYGRLAATLLPGQRAAAAIGSRVLPRDLKCNPRRLQQRGDSAAAGPAPPASAPSRVGPTSSPSTCHG